MTAFLIVDDHLVVRNGLKQILGEEFEAPVFGEAGTAEEALQRIRSARWDLILLDISMPGGSGLTLLRQIRDLSPRPPVLVLSMYPEREYAVRALRTGALGYVGKNNPRDELLEAIRSVLRGRRYVSPAVAESLLDEAAVISEQQHAALSNREYEVMCAIASGMRPSEIAAALSLSIKTVSTYRRRILHKMKFAGNAELTQYAVAHKLPSIPRLAAPQRSTAP